MNRMNTKKSHLKFESQTHKWLIRPYFAVKLNFFIGTGNQNNSVVGTGYHTLKGIGVARIRTFQGHPTTVSSYIH